MKIYSPLKGKLVALEEVSDPVFSEKMMGDGLAIIPKSNKVVAPVAGVLTSVFPTKHAFGIVTKDNIEVLIHIGLNTVDLKGKYFKAKVKQGDEVEVGDVLVEVDFKRIEKAGFSTITPIVILNKGKHSKLVYQVDKDIEILAEIIELK